MPRRAAKQFHLRLARFCGEDRGVAVTEYVLLLSLLLAAVLIAAMAFDGAVGAAWDDWAAWVRDLMGNMRDVSGASEPL